jgi:large subunit ribosomal protein L14
MLLERSRITIIDNSGAREVMLFSVSGSNNRGSVGIGCIAKGSVKKSAGINGKVQKGDIVWVLIVGTKNKIQRKDGSSIKFPTGNYGVIVNSKQGEPVGTRILGPVAREIKELNFSKIISLAPEVV